MRRKNSRSSTKSGSDRSTETSRKSRRQTKRQKRSSSRSSSDEPEEQKTIEEQVKEIVGEQSTEVTMETDEQPIWKVTSSATPSGEIHKLKFCLTRPLLSPEKVEKPTRRRRNKSGETDEEVSSNEKVPRKFRYRGTSDDNVEERDGDSDHQEDKKGKGKSKSKHKSKSEKNPQIQDIEDYSQSEISENVQVTPQSPQVPIDFVVDNENLPINESETVTSDETENHPSHHNETSSDSSDKTSGNMEDNVSNTIIQRESNTPPPILEQQTHGVVQSNETEFNFKGFESAPELIRADYSDQASEHFIQEVVLHDDIEIAQVQEEIIETSVPEAQIEIETVIEEEVPLQTVDTSHDYETVKEVIEESNQSNSNEPQIVSTCDELGTIELPVGQQKSFSSNSDGGDNVNSDQHVENSNSTVMEVETNQSDGDSVSMDVVLDTSTATQIKNDINVNVSESFSPVINQIEEVSEELKKLKNIACELMQTPVKAPVIRKWGNSFVGLELIKNSLQKIDINTIKEFCPNLEFLDENEVKLETRERKTSYSHEGRDRRIDRKVSIDFKSDNGEYKRLDTHSSVNSSEMDEMAEPEVDNSNIIAMNRKISIVDDTASKLKPPPSPAKNPVSEILYITNLVRPFTLKQLKELLERTGKIRENGFWTDRIKSKCYAYYQTNEEAEGTRNALHGVNWPIGNGKKLIIEYSTESELEKARNPTPPPPTPVPPQPAPVNIVIPEKELPTEVKPKIHKVEETSRVTKERQRTRSDGHVREWDIGKENMQKSRYRSRERDERERTERNDRHKRRRTPSPPKNYTNRKETKKEEDIPQKLMDDLFRKTKTTPSIYWLPLTPEEIATKQQQRLLRMAEHKRRMEESSRSRGDYGRGAPYRRRYD